MCALSSGADRADAKMLRCFDSRGRSVANVWVEPFVRLSGRPADGELAKECGKSNVLMMSRSAKSREDGLSV